MGWFSLLSPSVLKLDESGQEVLSYPAAFWRDDFTGVCLSHSWHYREIAKVKIASTALTI